MSTEERPFPKWSVVPQQVLLTIITLFLSASHGAGYEQGQTPGGPLQASSGKIHSFLATPELISEIHPPPDNKRSGATRVHGVSPYLIGDPEPSNLESRKRTERRVHPSLHTTWSYDAMHGFSVSQIIVGEDRDDVDRSIADPVLPLPLNARDWTTSSYLHERSPFVPRKTVLTNLPSMNMSDVQVLISFDAINLERAQIIFYPLIPDAPMSQKTTWMKLPDMECPYCSVHEKYSVVMPTQRHIAHLIVMPRGQANPACTPVRENLNHLCLAGLWVNGFLASGNQNPSLAGDYDTSYFAFTSIRTLEPLPNVLGVVVVYLCTSQTGLRRTTLWQAAVYEHGNTTDWEHIQDAPSIHLESGSTSVVANFLFGNSAGTNITLLRKGDANFTDVWVYNVLEKSWRECPKIPETDDAMHFEIDAAYSVTNDLLVVLVRISGSDTLHLLHPLDDLAEWSTFAPARNNEPMSRILLVASNNSIYMLGEAEASDLSSFEVMFLQPLDSAGGELQHFVTAPLIANHIFQDTHGVRQRSVDVISTEEANIHTCTALLMGSPYRDDEPNSENSVVSNITVIHNRATGIIETDFQSFSSPTYPEFGVLGDVMKIGNAAVVTGYDDYPNGTTSNLSVWCFTIGTSHWTRGATDNVPSPPPKSRSASFKYNSTSIVVYGGLDQNLHYQGDIWMFVFSTLDTCSGSWHYISNASYPPLPSWFTVSTLDIDSHIIIFGGSPSEVQASSPILELEISSLNTYTWRSIPLPEILNGTLHYTAYISLVRWNSNSLLLYGDPVILLTYSTANGVFALDAAEPLFIQNPGRISYELQSVCQSYFISPFMCSVYAPSLSQKCHQVLNLGYLNNTQCLAGYGYRWSESICVACPRGSWSSGGSRSVCRACPAATSTPHTASMSSSDCSPCAVDGLCNDHGLCASSGSTGVCSCEFGYLPHDNCLVPYFYIGSAVFILLVFAVVVSIYLYRQYRRKREVEKRILDESKRRVRDSDSVWVIKDTQLNMKKVIGSGSYGEAWLADFNDMPVVVKRLHRHSLVEKFAVEEFRRESELMKTRRHQNIVFFLGAGNDLRGEPFLVMEYISRGSLSGILAKDSISITHADRLKFMLDTAKGMRYLHGTQPPTIHRDLKPGNLLVTDRWVVKVADFGTARLMSRWSGRSLGNQPSSETGNEKTQLLKASNRSEAIPLTHDIGTVPYASPELLSRTTYTTSTDVYR